MLHTISSECPKVDDSWNGNDLGQERRFRLQKPVHIKVRKIVEDYQLNQEPIEKYGQSQGHVESHINLIDVGVRFSERLDTRNLLPAKSKKIAQKELDDPGKV